MTGSVFCVCEVFFGNLQFQLPQRKNGNQIKIEHWTNFKLQINIPQKFIRYVSWSFSELSFFANCFSVTRRWFELPRNFHEGVCGLLQFLFCTNYKPNFVQKKGFILLVYLPYSEYICVHWKIKTTKMLIYVSHT